MCLRFLTYAILEITEVGNQHGLCVKKNLTAGRNFYFFTYTPCMAS